MSVVSNGVAFTRSHHHSGYKLSKSHFSPTNIHLPHPFLKDTKTEALWWMFLRPTGFSDCWICEF